MRNVQAEISVIIVTHNSARYVRECLAALRTQGMRLQLIVVDNASRPAERPVGAEYDETEVIANTINRGFAPAVNQGLERVRAPYVLLLNPDVRMKSDALACLRGFLERTPRAAGVSARCWWNAAHTVLLLLTAVPTLLAVLTRAGGRHSRSLRVVREWWQIRQAQRWWFARGAVRVPAISAACVLIPLRVLDRVGPLDARFPFYYEEVEWSLRARRCGYQLFALPGAEAVHAFGHSCRNGSRRVQRWAAVSGRRYWQGRYGRLGARLAALLSAQPVSTVLAPLHDFGAMSAPPFFEWSPVAGPQVFEVAFDPLFESSAAVFPRGHELQWPTALWGEMPITTYHARLLCGTPLRPVMYWQWQRMPARSPDLEVAERQGELV